MGENVLNKTESGLVPYSACAGCCAYWLLEDLPKMRLRNPMKAGNYKVFMRHMARLRLFPPDKHFVQAWMIIKAYWASKGETKLPNAVEATLFGKEGTKGAGMMACLHACGVLETVNPLECSHQHVRKVFKIELLKLLKERGDDTHAAERARRPKLNLSDFADVIIRRVIPTLARLSSNESFDELSQTGRQEQSAKRFAVQPISILCHVSGDMFACRMKTKDGMMHPIDKSMALKAIKLWEGGPDSLNDFLLMTKVRLVTPNAAWPCSVFNQSSISPLTRGLRIKLRAEGTPLPDLLNKSKHELNLKKKPKGRPARKKGMFKSYWDTHKTPNMQMIVGVQKHANSTVAPIIECPFCNTSVKSKHGLKMHLNSCKSTGPFKKRKSQNVQPAKHAKPANCAKPSVRTSQQMSWTSVACQALNGNIRSFNLPEEEEFNKLKSSTSISNMSLRFFNDEYIQASIDKKWLWIFSAELWERVNHDRRVGVYTSADYLSNMLEWYETHDLNQCNVYWDGISETKTYIDPIGVFQVHPLACKGRLVEGCHRLLVMVLKGHGFFPVELQALEKTEGLLDISWMSFWEVVEGTSENVMLRRVTPNGFEVRVPAEISLLSPADGLVSSDVFGAGYHLGSAPYFGGPILLSKLVDYISKCQFGPRSVMVDMVNEEQQGQQSEWIVVVWNKTFHSRNRFSVKARIHVTSACEKKCASLEDLLSKKLNCKMLYFVSSSIGKSGHTSMLFEIIYRACSFAGDGVRNCY